MCVSAVMSAVVWRVRRCALRLVCDLIATVPPLSCELCGVSRDLPVVWHSRSTDTYIGPAPHDSRGHESRNGARRGCFRQRA